MDENLKQETEAMITKRLASHHRDRLNETSERKAIIARILQSRKQIAKHLH